ncbi:MAG: hypothetical protein MZV63_23740 [Marinilabiliales bacterium]|nr:hypothetical protein [Marinilabiliales bacterium]
MDDGDSTSSAVGGRALPICAQGGLDESSPEHRWERPGQDPRTTCDRRRIAVACLVSRRAAGGGRRLHLVLLRRLDAEQVLHEVVPPPPHHVVRTVRAEPVGLVAGTGAGRSPCSP